MVAGFQVVFGERNILQNESSNQIIIIIISGQSKGREKKIYSLVWINHIHGPEQFYYKLKQEAYWGMNVIIAPKKMVGRRQETLDWLTWQPGAQRAWEIWKDSWLVFALGAARSRERLEARL